MAYVPKPDNWNINYLATYVFGRVEQFIEDYAKSSQVSSHELAHRVATLLYAQAGGEGMGISHQVPSVRRNGSPRGVEVEQVEVGSIPPGPGPSGKVRLRDYAKEYSRRKAKSWTPEEQRQHWTQLPENRKEMKKAVERMLKANRKRLKQKQAKSEQSRGMSRYWSRMTQEARSQEMRRRRQVTAQKALGSQ